MFQRVLSSSDFCSKIGNSGKVGSFTWILSFVHCFEFRIICTFFENVLVEVVIAQFFFFQVKKFDLYAGAGVRLNIF